MPKIYNKNFLRTLHKIPQFHLISWCENFMESHTMKLGEITVFYVVLFSVKKSSIINFWQASVYFRLTQCIYVYNPCIYIKTIFTTFFWKPLRSRNLSDIMCNAVMLLIRIYHSNGKYNDTEL